MMAKHYRAYFALLCVSLCWGASFPIFKHALQAFTPAQAIFWRYGMAAVCLTPALRGAGRAPQVWRWGILLGVVNAVVYFLVATALHASSSSSRVAFLMGTSVIITPFLGYVLQRERLTLAHVTAAVGSLAGLLVFTQFSLNGAARTDLLVLLAALIFAGGLRILHAATHGSLTPPWLLLCYEFFATSVCAIPLMWWNVGAEDLQQPVGVLHVLPLVYSALLPTVVCGFLIASYQKDVGPTAAAMIYPLQSVFSLVVSITLFGESIDARTIGGGALIFIATLVPIVWRASPPLAARR